MNEAIQKRLDRSNEYSRAMAKRIFSRHLTPKEAYQEGMKDGYQQGIDEGSRLKHAAMKNQGALDILLQCKQ